MYIAHCKYHDLDDLTSSILSDVIKWPSTLEDWMQQDSKVVKVDKSKLRNADGSPIDGIGQGLFAKVAISEGATVCSLVGQFYVGAFTENEEDRWCWVFGSPEMKKHLVYKTFEGCLANKINGCKVNFKNFMSQIIDFILDLAHRSHCHLGPQIACELLLSRGLGW
jgi:hypothetical protein